MPLPLVITANAAVGRRWAGHATGILAGVTAGVTFLFGALDIAGAGTTSAGSSGHSPLFLDVGIMATAVVAAALVSKPVRERIARILPVDPDNPVHALALVLAVILFGTQVSSITFTDVLAADRALSPLTLADLLTQEIPFLILAAAGVGIFIRRSTSQATARLGLVVPRWWQVALALAGAGGFVAFGQGMDALSHAWTPQIARQVEATTKHLFGGLGGPVDIAVLALAPGICEEILFRGALQPRIGLLATALLFTSIHTQYGLSLDTLSVFVIAIGLGLIRQYANTTASCICHVAYNLVVGIGIADSMVGVAAAVELVLIATATYAIWANRRRAAAMPANP